MTRFRCVVLIGLGALLGACQPHATPDPEAPLELEEVSLPPDALVDPTLDQKEVREPTANLSGQLPSSFPADLPTFPGVTVTDLGDPEPWIEFLVAQPVGRVTPDYSRQLQSAGWTIDGGILRSDGTRSAVNGPGGAVEIVVEAKGPSTRIVVHY